MMKINTIILGIISFVALGVMPLAAQDNPMGAEKKKDAKAWEVGAGGSVFQFSRTQFSDFTKLEDGGYDFDLKLKHAVYGVDLYVARELTRHLYLDLQGTVGITSDKLSGRSKTKMLYMIGPGLQWRLGEYFGSRYIDPYLRAGVGYMNKDFSIHYMGAEGETENNMEWELGNTANKDGRDKKHMMPVSLGVGLNMWLNDHIGVGLQADYLVMPYSNVANTLQGTARLIWRIGGKSKKRTPAVQYVDRVVEKPVEKRVEVPVQVEKVVERVEYTKLYELFNNIYFEFDKATLTAKSEEVISEIAEILKQNTDKKFLITGYTDAVGSPTYNLDLSRRRALAVVDALVAKGVSSSILKSVGVGRTVSHAAAKASEQVREGDRKVTIELVKNMHYWDTLPVNQ